MIITSSNVKDPFTLKNRPLQSTLPRLRHPRKLKSNLLWMLDLRKHQRCQTITKYHPNHVNHPLPHLPIRNVGIVFLNLCRPRPKQFGHAMGTGKLKVSSPSFLLYEETKKKGMKRAPRCKTTHSNHDELVPNNKCNICRPPLPFSSSTKLKEHMYKHTEDWPHPCPFDYCAEGFLTEKELRNHQRNTHPPWREAIDSSSRVEVQNSTPHRYRLTVNAPRETPTIHASPPSSRDEKDVRNSLHPRLPIAIRHAKPTTLRFGPSQETSKPRDSLFSDFGFPSSTKLKEPIYERTEHLPYPCPFDYCQKAFLTEKELKTHQKSTHPSNSPKEAINKSKENPMRVSPKNRNSEIISSLPSELSPFSSTPSKEEIISPHTSVSSKRSGEKSKPAKTVQKRWAKKKKKKVWKCDECGKCLQTSSTLRKHRYRHNNNWPFRCRFCGKGCATRWHHDRHEGSHTGEKHFLCDKCQKKFTSEDM